MKNTIKYLFIILSIISLSCTKEIEKPENEGVNGKQVNEKLSNELAISVTLPENTKITHSLDVDGKTIKPAWAVGDHIRVYNKTSNPSNTHDGTWAITSSKDISPDGLSAVFRSTDSNVQPTDELVIYYYTPFSDDIMNEYYDFSSQNGKYQNLPEVLSASGTLNNMGSLTSALTYLHFYFDQSTNPGLVSSDCTFKYVVLSKDSGDLKLCKSAHIRKNEYQEGSITITPETPFSVKASGEWSIDFYVAVHFDNASDYTEGNLKLFFSNADYTKSDDNVVHSYTGIQHMECTMACTKHFLTGHIYKVSPALTYESGLVGEENNSSAFWGAFSPYYTIPAGKTLELQFKNYSSQAFIYNNWNSVVTNDVDRGVNGYSEYAVQRADTYGWGNSWSADRLLVTSEGGFVATDWWDYFKEHLNNTDVSITVDHTNYGSVLVNLRAVTTEASTNSDGYVTFIQYFTLPATTENVRFFLTTDYSHFIIQGVSFYDSTTGLSYLKGSDYYIADDDLNLALIKGNGIDNALFGHYGWNETIQGANSHYVCEVPIDASLLTATTGTLSANAGEQTFTNGATLNGQSVNYKANVIKGSSANGSTILEWGDSYSTPLIQITSGSSATRYMYVYSAGGETWSCPSVILAPVNDFVASTAYDYTDRAFARLDNWVDVKGSVTSSNDGNWVNDWVWGTDNATFKTYLNRAKVTVKISNSGDNKATVQYGVNWLNGDYHYQNYKNIGIDSDSMFYTINMTNGYVVFVDFATQDAATAAGWPDVTPISE